MTEVGVYACSICNEPSTEICVRCTKDACRNHRCERCKACSDCCECEVPLTGPEVPAEILSVSPTEAAIPAPPEASEEPDLSIPPVPVPPESDGIVAEPADTDHS